MGTISKNFSYKEFEKSDTADRLGIINIIADSKVRDAVKALVMLVLQPLREAWQEPLHVNSGYRSPALNKAVGGVPTSQHTKGEAADVSCNAPYKLAQLAVELDLPFDQMILYPNFVHFSHKLNGTQRRQILYHRTYSWDKFS